MVDGRDIARFTALLLGGVPSPAERCAADVGEPADCTINTGDVAAFVDCLLAAGCD